MLKKAVITVLILNILLAPITYISVTLQDWLDANQGMTKEEFYKALDNGILEQEIKKDWENLYIKYR